MDGGEGWRMINGGEGWRMITCATAGGGAQDTTIFNRIMLRFRPIAPRPANVGQGSAASLADNKGSAGSKRRTKRKYVRVSKRTQKILSSSSNEVGEKDGEAGDGKSEVVTLQLLPERSVSSVLAERDGSWCNINDDNLDINKEGLSFDHHTQQNSRLHSQVQFVQHSHQCAYTIKRAPPDADALDHPMPSDGLDNDIDRPSMDGVDGHDVADRRVVESWVTVESVTHAYTCMEGGGRGLLGCRDVERVMNDLDEDTCPGFISEGWNRVEWVNKAYRKMVRARATEEDGRRYSPEKLLRVWLAVREQKLLPWLCYCYQGFTCWVRLRHTWQKEKYSQMLPCDVWRMDTGCFAWRLDVEAALTLGR